MTIDPDSSDLDIAFDETWYLKAYPDVAKAIEDNVVQSALEHYLNHGKIEGRKPSDSLTQPNPKAPLVLLHIPKTAGTSVRAAFEREGKTILHANPEFKFERNNHGHFDLISGHFGYQQAKRVGGDIITILRDPVDRFLSYYYHLRVLYQTGEDVNVRSELAYKYGIDDFVNITDDGNLIIDQYNAVTWQVLRGTKLEDRSAFRTETAATDDQMLHMAMQNLASFRIVGFQHKLSTLCERMEDIYQIKLKLERDNENLIREYRENISRNTIKRIYDWVYLDIELFNWAQRDLI